MSAVSSSAPTIAASCTMSSYSSIQLAPRARERRVMAAIRVSADREFPASTSVKGQLVLPRDVEVASVAPHAHYLGKNLKLTAHLPNGTTVPLIWIKEWDFNWQGTYVYEKRIALPKDTKVELEYV